MARTRTQRNLAYGAESVMLYGVLSHDGASHVPIAGASTVVLRELAAVVKPAPWERVEASSEALQDYRRVVENAFHDHSLLPAPFGTVFKSRETLLHWLEVHYVTLVDAMGFVHDRAMARVRVAVQADAGTSLTTTRELRVQDFETTVFDSFRFLKRSAVAVVTFATEGAPDARSIEASFLVEREKWNAFTEAVDEEQRRLPELAIEESGPWPPYDFVRLQFGA